MKKFLLSILVLFPLFLNAQDTESKDTSYWDIGGVTAVTYNQTLLKYWAAGGNNSTAISGMFDAHANYQKDKINFQNSLSLGYGLQRIMNQPFRKTDDKIDLSSNFGLKATNKLYYTVLLGFKSQFTKGYDYLDNGDSTKISNFFAPAYFVHSVGINYVPSKNLSIYASFLTGKTTFVMDEDLSAIGAFGVDTGKTIRYEFGSYLKVNFEKNITDNFLVSSKLTLFSNYLKNPQNIDVDFQLLASYKIWKALSLNYQMQAIYDDDILVLVDPQTGRQGKRLQLKQIFGVGLSYSF